MRPLGYESGGLVPSVPSGAVSCRPVRGSCRGPSCAAELRVDGLQMGCTKATRRTLRNGLHDCLLEGTTPDSLGKCPGKRWARLSRRVAPHPARPRDVAGHFLGVADDRHASSRTARQLSFGYRSPFPRRTQCVHDLRQLQTVVVSASEEAPTTAVGRAPPDNVRVGGAGKDATWDGSSRGRSPHRCYWQRAEEGTGRRRNRPRREQRRRSPPRNRWRTSS